MRCKFLLLFCFVFLSCEDKTVSNSSQVDADPPARLVTDNPPDAEQPDVHVLDWSPPPEPEPELTREEICAMVPLTNAEEYCNCFRDCCQTQRWYCPPNPRQTIEAMQVIVEICDENKRPCEFGTDEDCPPPEIISRSECYVAHECPPGSTGEFLQWFECQLEDGRIGQQRVLCDKGSLIHGPCRPCDPEQCDGEDNDCDNLIDEGRFQCETQCGEGWAFCVEGQLVDCTATEPSEEVCNFEDDDCDDLVDENQRNACNECGIVPADICDGLDNDCDEFIDEELSRECETACGRGIETCTAGRWISCTAKQPADEECDGEDNDCDGLVDEQLSCLCTIQDVGNLMPCTEPPLLCGQGFKTCECVDEACQEMRMTECAALCTYVPQPPPCDPLVGLVLEDEECNNFDEDCDQLVDEELTQACYTGDPDTLFVGVCAPGEVYCRSGAWGNDRNNIFEAGLCLGEITPTQEICDGADNDCDGEVDYGEEIRETDILFIVDWSGSMDDEIEAVKIALNRFSQHFAAEEPLRWGLIIGPKEFPGSIDEVLVLVSDISPFDQFLAAFAALGSEGMDTGSEMLLDALYLSIRNISPAANVDIASTGWWRNTDSIPAKEMFNVTWRPASDRIVIIFTDEEEQSYLRDAADLEGPNRPITTEIVQAAAAAAINLKVYTFSTGVNEWENIAISGNGSNFELVPDALSMYNDLMSIIDEACLPREENQAAAATRFYNNYVYVSYQRYDYVNRLCL